MSSLALSEVFSSLASAALFSERERGSVGYRSWRRRPPHDKQHPAIVRLTKYHWFRQPEPLRHLPMKIASRWGRCPLPPRFRTVSASIAQTYLNCYYQFLLYKIQNEEICHFTDDQLSLFRIIGTIQHLAGAYTVCFRFIRQWHLGRALPHTIFQVNIKKLLPIFLC